MFYDCKSLNNLPDISKWDTKNVENMSCMFYDYKSLNNLPDISKWDTKNVENMNGMFSGCNSLKNLPDISKWDTKNVENISSIFDGFSTLINFPGISNLNTNSIKYDDILDNNKNNMMNYLLNNNIINNDLHNQIIGNINMNIKQLSNNSDTFTVIFKETGHGFKNKGKIPVSVKKDEKISDIIQKYREKNNNFDESLIFIFNAEKLNPSLTVGEFGLKNDSKITVLSSKIFNI